MNQKYLLDALKPNSIKPYLVMSPFFNALRPLISFSTNTKNFNFVLSGMGRTGLGVKLKNGADPNEYYNSSSSETSQALKRQILVREFWKQGPQVPSGRRSYKTYVKEAQEKARFNSWKNGETGYPLIDAGMIQLAEEGWMPNRVRMLCASFLTKNLRVDWQLGEKHFAKKLVDYNSFSNLGNWLWIAGEAYNSRMTDVLSPDVQLKKYDPQLNYCRSILSSSSILKELSANDLIKEPSLYKVPITFEYTETKAEFLNLIQNY